jgi:hypothetical protein
MKIKILSPRCPESKKIYAVAEKASASSGVSAALGKFEKLDEVMRCNVMMTPEA